MKRKLIIISSVILATMVVVILVCNILVVKCSKGKCYDDIDSIPHRPYGMLLGTGRSKAPSPYYDARVDAAIELLKAGKIDVLIISGENLYDDYCEVDSMAADVVSAVPNADIILDKDGINTYASLRKGSKVITGDNIIIISQKFHNQRAVYYGSRIWWRETTIAYNAKDTEMWYWNIWRFLRETLARTKAVFYPTYYDIEFVFNAQLRSRK